MLQTIQMELIILCREEYATVNEVNEVLANNYVLKSDCYTKSECDNKYAKYLDVYHDYYAKIEIDNKFDEYYDWKYCNENFVTKSEFEELKKENVCLKATIAAFETRLSALEKKINLNIFFIAHNFFKNFLNGELFESARLGKRSAPQPSIYY